MALGFWSDPRTKEAHAGLVWLLIFRDAKQHTLLKNILKHEWSLGQCDGSASKGAVAESDDLSLVLWDVRGRKGRSDSLKVR